MKHSKCVSIKEEVPCDKLISCTEVIEIRNLSKCKLENETVQKVKDEEA
jgi:hypothetical protein